MKLKKYYLVFIVLNLLALAFIMIPATQGLLGSFEVVSKPDSTHVASENLLPKYILGLMILIAGIAGSLLFFYRVTRGRREAEEGPAEGLR